MSAQNAKSCALHRKIGPWLAFSPARFPGDTVDRFDANYYRRYYQDRRTRVADPEYYRRLARFIASYSALLDISIVRIADLGCGTGALQNPLLAEFKRASYVGVEQSAYACQKFGWKQSCASEFTAELGFDLVVCHDVMQYLDDKRAAKALTNFRLLTDKLVYFSVLTEEDWRRNVDQDLTDGEVYLRPANWYRRRLKPSFTNLGGGLYLAAGNDAVVYALEGGF